MAAGRERVAPRGATDALPPAEMRGSHGRAAPATSGRCALLASIIINYFCFSCHWPRLTPIFLSSSHPGWEKQFPRWDIWCQRPAPSPMLEPTRASPPGPPRVLRPLPLLLLPRRVGAKLYHGYIALDYQFPATAVYILRECKEISEDNAALLFITL